MLNEESILKTLTENINPNQFQIEEIGLFGSYSRNEQNDNSDIDILVNFKKGAKTFDNYMELKFYLENIFNRKVDLVISDALKPDLKNVILESVKYAPRS